ncbi:UPF0415 protein C7orf25 homolog isoform X2 [Procambarus clarkii]|uniref:UPF0415 protein C7orf25 homolog isoform X2 n=1 Tax=Procambarus clarkii TaxID=6728 RepID=UPI001E677FAC|nr:UPF0415 protein C7orf25-like isoform X1 [Procambarus clarkii]
MTGGKAAELALNRINEAKDLLDQVCNLEMKSVNGASKLRKRIEAEIKFLNKGLKRGSELKEEHVMCSNLGQLGAIASVAAATPNATKVLQTFCINGFEKIVVDVVGEGGKLWIKVIKRNPKALHLLFILGGRNGVKPIDDVADDFLICAQHHPVFYSTPKIVFWFCSGVSESLARSLEDKGVEIKGEIIPDHELGLPDYVEEDSETESENSDSEYEYSSDESNYINENKTTTTIDCSVAVEGESQMKFMDLNGEFNNTYVKQKVSEFDDSSLESVESNMVPALDEDSSDRITVIRKIESCQSSEVNATIPAQVQDLKVQNITSKDEEAINKLNLDVTAMIAYVTATTNGSANFIFKDRFLTEQAECERNNPVKKTLEDYFKGRELLACQEAVSHFLEIVNTIGGAGEKARAQELVTRLRIVKGEDYFKDKLKLGGRVRELSRIIFGTGHVHRAITVTSNGGFVRSTEHRGVKVAVLYHKPRALTEAKEATATPL